MTDFKKLKVVELRAELAARNLPQTGKRDELIERLEEFEFQHAMPTDSEQITASADTIETATEIEIQPAISPVIPPSQTAEEIEEEKRRQRALRFGLDPNQPVKIELTIKRLEHALPNRPFHHHRGRRHHNHSHHHNRQVSINKP